jgi:hypothetical protein
VTGGRTCPAPQVVGSSGEFIAMIKSLLTVAAVVVFIVAMASGARCGLALASLAPLVSLAPLELIRERRGNQYPRGRDEPNVRGRLPQMPILELRSATQLAGLALATESCSSVAATTALFSVVRKPRS